MSSFLILDIDIGRGLPPIFSKKKKKENNIRIMKNLQILKLLLYTIFTGLKKASCDENKTIKTAHMLKR